MDSAKAVAGLFPEGDEFDLANLYSIGPWWNLVYTLVQSFSVLLLEVVYEPVQIPHNRREIILSLKKLLRWLRAMQTTNLVAARAYSIVMKVIHALVTAAKIVSLILVSTRNRSHVPDSFWYWRSVVPSMIVS